MQGQFCCLLLPLVKFKRLQCKVLGLFSLPVHCVLAPLPLGLVHGIAGERPAPPGVHGGPGGAALTQSPFAGLHLQGESQLGLEGMEYELKHQRITKIGFMHLPIYQCPFEKDLLSGARGCRAGKEGGLKETNNLRRENRTDIIVEKQ